MGEALRLSKKEYRSAVGARKGKAYTGCVSKPR